LLYKFDGKSAEIGQGTYVSEEALVIGDVKIGDNCYVGHGAILRGDYGSIFIGTGTAVEEGAIIHAPPHEASLIGERVTIGHGAIIHSTKIGDFSVIGMGAILSIRSEIGANSIVAEGAVVKMRQLIPDKVVAGGNPARVLRAISKKDVEFWTKGKEIYIELARKYLAGSMEKV
jgi:carbonic anhydrase/acetyltransferase-like protein (isoleucine patch superfamily)